MCKKCEHCGEIISANANICNHCGKEVNNISKNFMDKLPKNVKDQVFDMLEKAQMYKNIYSKGGGLPYLYTKIDVYHYIEGFFKALTLLNVINIDNVSIGDSDIGDGILLYYHANNSTTIHLYDSSYIEDKQEIKI